MINIGEIQKLKIKRFTSVGAFLNEDKVEDEDILLPKAQIPEGAKVDDEVEVMVYRDSKDRIIATTNKPKITLGELGHLMVVSSSKIGHFLDWGLEKDLFMPFAETVGHVEKGKTYLVGVYLDKSKRLCATMKVKDMLSTESPYKENDRAKGTIYSINRDFGAFVAVDDKYDGLIHKRELLGVYEVGEIVEVRINKVLEDGKLDLSLRDRGYIQMDDDINIITDKLKANGGKLNLNDKSSPDKIRNELQISKSGFKRAIGRMYRDGIINITDNGIEFKDK
ncbi:S1-like domain-containing RNA-binding protein [Tissierella sp. Yu-01]|uniref:CvfB family protein n=1 Tax=Tissierella sp. Yu-01 TaxID=3035694 RepID=UPI00240D531D|nr:S1-like domain-containing RNA-binding protein [Tissierella sp. Yu-01]WFA09178.1 S1-like domain-containing RNA-binding protein [Tissierella sp. Yu-01]